MANNLFTGATNSNWGTSTNWSLGAVPTAADGNVAYFDNTSPNCTVNTSARVCNNINFNGGTGYTNTITMTNTISVSGNITFGASMLVSGTSAIIAHATGTLTSNAFVWPNAFTMDVLGTTITLADNASCSGLLTFGAVNPCPNLAGAFTFTTAGGLAMSNVGGQTTNTTTTIKMTGGTWSGTGPLATNLTFAGNVTWSSASNRIFVGATMTYTSGTITVTSSTLQLNTSGTTTLALNGMSINNMLTGTNSTITMSNALDVNGTLTIAGSNTLTTFNGSTINIAGSLTDSSTTGAVAGTTNFIMDGTGTLSSASSGAFRNNLEINTAGTITLSGTFIYALGTLLFTAGTWSVGTSILVLGETNQSVTCTINASGFNMNTIQFAGAAGLRTCTFNGTSGFTTNNFSCTVTGHTLVFKAGNTYTVSSSLTLTGTSASPIIFKSGTASSYAIFTLSYGATQSVAFVTSTDIDSSGGQIIWDYKGTLLRTINWNVLAPLLTLGRTFVE